MNGLRFKSDNGWVMGGGWGRSYPGLGRVFEWVYGCWGGLVLKTSNLSPCPVPLVVKLE